MARIELKDGRLLVPDHVELACVEGDGVGKEITPVMKTVTEAAVQAAYGETRSIEWVDLLAGTSAYEACGSYLPDDTIRTFAACRMGIKGPLCTPVGGGIRSLNVALRQGLDLYVCLRPVRWYKGIASPVKHPERVNVTVFRENTEDIYAGIEWEAQSPEAKRFYEFLHDEMHVDKVRFPATSAFGVKPVSEEGSKRLVRAACRYATATGANHVTLVHKGNIMKYTEGGFRRWGYDVAQQEFPSTLRIDDCIADAFLQNALLKPDHYDVVATLNLNGDYISDMLAAQVGGIGIAPGANINFDEGRYIYEATHGTAPDIAGRNVVNPSSMLLSAVMMLRDMRWAEAADLVEAALENAFGQGLATADLARLMPNGHELGTQEFADVLLEYLYSHKGSTND